MPAHRDSATGRVTTRGEDAAPLSRGGNRSIAGAAACTIDRDGSSSRSGAADRRLLQKCLELPHSIVGAQHHPSAAGMCSATTRRFLAIVSALSLAFGAAPAQCFHSMLFTTHFDQPFWTVFGADTPRQLQEEVTPYECEPCIATQTTFYFAMALASIALAACACGLLALETCDGTLEEDGHTFENACGWSVAIVALCGFATLSGFFWMSCNYYPNSSWLYGPSFFAIGIVGGVISMCSCPCYCFNFWLTMGCGSDDANSCAMVAVLFQCCCLGLPLFVFGIVGVATHLSAADNGNPWRAWTDDPCAGQACVNNASLLDSCGVCQGDNSTCTGCDGTVLSGLQLDVCGVCDGDASSCPSCTAVVDRTPWYILVLLVLHCIHMIPALAIFVSELIAIGRPLSRSGGYVTPRSCFRSDGSALSSEVDGCWQRRRQRDRRMLATDMLVCAFCSAVLVALVHTLKNRCATMPEESVANFVGTCTFVLWIGSLFVLGRCSRPYIYASIVLEETTVQSFDYSYSRASMQDFSPTKVCSNRRVVWMFLHSKNFFLRWYFCCLWVPTCMIFATLGLPSAMPPFLIVLIAVIYGSAAVAWVLELRRWRVRTAAEFKQHARDHRRQQYIRSIQPALFHAYQRLAFSALLSPTLGPALLQDLPFDIAERIFTKQWNVMPVAHDRDTGLHSDGSGLRPWASYTTLRMPSFSTVRSSMAIYVDNASLAALDGSESACFVKWCDHHVAELFGAASSGGVEWSYWCCTRWKTGGMADVDHKQLLLAGQVEMGEIDATALHPA